MSNRRLKKVQQCCANTTSGARCNRYAAPGELVCAKHRTDAEPSGVIATQDPINAMAELRRLMRDRDSRVRLRAVAHYLTRLEKEKKECPRCAANVEKERANSEFVDRATPAQREDVRRLIQAIHTIRAAVLSGAVSPGVASAHDTPVALRDGEETSHAAVIEHHQPPRPRAEVPVGPASERTARTTASADNDVVMVWRDGELRPEPRSARAWKEVR